MASGTESEIQELEVLKNTLRDLKEDILSKFDEIMETCRQRMEEINEGFKTNFGQAVKKKGPNTEAQISSICATACKEVKEIHADTQEMLNTVWTTSSSLIYSVGENLGEFSDSEEFYNYVEALRANLESTLVGLLDHLNLLVMLYLQDQDDLYENFKKANKPEIDKTKYTGFFIGTR